MERSSCTVEKNKCGFIELCSCKNNWTAAKILFKKINVRNAVDKKLFIKYSF